MTKDRAELILRLLDTHKKLLRTELNEADWLALKLNCSLKQAERNIAQARDIVGRKRQP